MKQTTNPVPLVSTESPDSSGWSASQYNNAAPFVYSPAFTAPILELLAAQQGERVIDFGCGSGEVTMKIAKTVGVDGLVIGVDFSENMVSLLPATCIMFQNSESFVQDHQSKIEWPERSLRIGCSKPSIPNRVRVDQRH
jgi:SAM-dependent methyltransferase